MTVQTRFHSWQSSPMVPDPRRCSPLLTTMLAYLQGRWPGQNLGCWMARPVTGGTSPSSHASGAALDWRYQDPGVGRQRAVNEILPFLLNDSLELGVQAIHDYVASRIWRPPGTSGRPAGGVEAGWRAQTPSTGNGMGQAWATYFHIEVVDTRWSDTRSIPEMLGDSPQPAPEPEPEPEDDDVYQSVIIIAGEGSATPGSQAIADPAFRMKTFIDATDSGALAALGIPMITVAGATFDRIPNSQQWTEVS